MAKETKTIRIRYTGAAGSAVQLDRGLGMIAAGAVLEVPEDYGRDLVAEGRPFELAPGKRAGDEEGTGEPSTPKAKK